MVLKAIETRYAGCRFRSRLEARWAVFFDNLGVKWQYEPEGFDLDGLYYLPDFWLPRERVWLEIKPTRPVDAEVEKCVRFSDALRARYREVVDEAWMVVPVEEAVDLPADIAFGVWMLIGEPYLDERQAAYEVAWDRCVTHRFFCPDDCAVVRYTRNPQVLVRCPLCKRLDRDGYDIHSDYLNCPWCDIWDRNRRPEASDEGYFHKGLTCRHGEKPILLPPVMQRAYNAARGARFEHGERA